MKKIFIAAIAVVMLIVLAAVPVCARNVIEIGKDINIGEEQAVDNAIAIAGQITVSGLVENNVVTLGGSIVLARGAVVRGNVVCIGGVVAQGNGAQIFGDSLKLVGDLLNVPVVQVGFDDVAGFVFSHESPYGRFRSRARGQGQGGV